MQLEFESLKNALVIKVDGDIDHHSCEEIRSRIDQEIANQNKKNLIFDMERVGFMDSSGIGVIIGRYKLITSQKGRVIMTCMKPHVKRIYEICGLQRIIPACENLDQAVKSL